MVPTVESALMVVVTRIWMTSFGCDIPRLHLWSSHSYLCTVYWNSLVHADDHQTVLLILACATDRYCSDTEYSIAMIRTRCPVL